jgi:hypothetical protein
VDDHTIAKRGAGVQRCTRVNAALLADVNALANDRARFDTRSISNGCVFTHHSAWTYGDILAKFHMIADRRHRMDSLCRWHWSE